MDNFCESFVTYFLLICNAFILIVCSVLIQSAEITKIMIAIFIMGFPLCGLYGIMSESLRVLRIYFALIIMIIALTICLIMIVFGIKLEYKWNCSSWNRNRDEESCAFINIKRDYILSVFIIIFLISIIIEVILAVCTWFYIDYLKTIRFRRLYVEL